MISKPFNAWRKAQSTFDSTWENYLKHQYKGKPSVRGNITSCLGTWHQVRNNDDVESFFNDNPDAGTMVVDQCNEITIVHHPFFTDTGRMFGYTTNTIYDKPIEIVFHQDHLNPISPTLLIGKTKTAPKVVDNTIKDTSEGNPPSTEDKDEFENGETNQDNPNNTNPDQTDPVPPPTKQPVKKKRKYTHRNKKENLDIKKMSLIALSCSVLKF
jgi:hypothetical protein